MINSVANDLFMSGSSRVTHLMVRNILSAEVVLIYAALRLLHIRRCKNIDKLIYRRKLNQFKSPDMRDSKRIRQQWMNLIVAKNSISIASAFKQKKLYLNYHRQTHRHVTYKTPLFASRIKRYSPLKPIFSNVCVRKIVLKNVTYVKFQKSLLNCNRKS